MRPPFGGVSEETDMLAAIVRWHLYVENQLEQFVRASLPHPEELEDRLTYAGLVRLALACGLRRDLKRPLNALGALRNRFSHDIDTKLTEREIAVFKEAFKDFAYDPPRTADFYDVTNVPRERLLDYVVNIWNAVEAEAVAARAKTTSALGNSN